MKNIFAFLLWSACVAFGQATPFTYHFVDGQRNPITNAAYAKAYPQKTSGAVVFVNTNDGLISIPSTNQYVLQPAANGRGTNSLMPNNWQIFIPDLNFGFLVNIPPAPTNSSGLLLTNDLSTYVVQLPAIYVSASYWALITNGLGYTPGTTNGADVLTYLGFQPATNSIASIAALLNYWGITNAAGFTLATNGGALTWQQISNALGYMPIPPTYAGVSNALAFTVATNSAASLSNVLGGTFLASSQWTPSGLTNVFGFTPMANTSNAITAALGYQAMPYNLASITNVAGGNLMLATYLSLTNTLGFPVYPPSSFTTNLQFLWVSNSLSTNLMTFYITNGVVRTNSVP